MLKPKMNKCPIVKAATKVSPLIQDSPLPLVSEPPVFGGSSALQCPKTNCLPVLLFSPIVLRSYSLPPGMIYCFTN